MRFLLTAHWWRLAVVTSHSASPILPHRKKSTQLSAIIRYVPATYFPTFLSRSDTTTIKVARVEWSPDGKRLVAVTSFGHVIQVTNSNAHSTVSMTGSGVRFMFVALPLLIPCPGVWLCVQSQWDPCCRRVSSNNNAFGCNG